MWCFFLTNLSFLHPRMFCSNFGLNWPSGSGEDFLISLMRFRCFVIISPWKRAWPFICRNLTTLYPKMVCAKFGPYWFWRRRKYEKFTTTATEKLWSEKLTWACGNSLFNKMILDVCLVAKVYVDFLQKTLPFTANVLEHVLSKLSVVWVITLTW